jgi:hypothetical protein
LGFLTFGIGKRRWLARVDFEWCGLSLLNLGSGKLGFDLGLLGFDLRLLGLGFGVGTGLLGLEE